MCSLAPVFCFISSLLISTTHPLILTAQRVAQAAARGQSSHHRHHPEDDEEAFQRRVNEVFSDSGAEERREREESRALRSAANVARLEHYDTITAALYTEVELQVSRLNLGSRSARQNASSDDDSGKPIWSNLFSISVMI